MSDTPQKLDEEGREAPISPITMYTTSWCGDCVVTKSYLQKFAIPFREINIEADPEAAEFVMKVNGGRRSVPTLVYNGDAASLSGFSRAKLDAFLARHQLRPQRPQSV
ncbi:glutaredoxin [Truepera radiovictrix DSM 17093]|uniref:Glutaredoxin n=2 Tax=Truepera TaxID=332248 RepID=D7CW66_TRURR|nr:glutaredoxin domain-containing protein [Truepera radiovictrix]ADI14329.1 glutaredoxin [Truepera radiovictrix DSM 17093]WMT57113.1 glutaredoxin domain-containing protein [Truepera radiovictrix]